MRGDARLFGTPYSIIWMRIPSVGWVSAYLSHDILGNTATGEQPAVRVDQGLTLAIMALHLTMPCTRMLFMSEEWAATSPFPYLVGYDDRVLLEAIRAGRAAELTDKGCKEAYSQHPPKAL